MTLNELYSLYPNLQQKFEEFESREYVSVKEIKECLFNLGVKELFKNFNKKSFRIREDLNEIFIKISQLIHKNKYNYSNTIFRNSTEKTKIICNSCGTELNISFTNHINGKGG